MEQTINTFEKGLQKDFNKIDTPNNSMYHLFNGRILSDKGQDNFSISSLESNIFKHNLQSNFPNYKLIGYTIVRDDIVLYLAGDENIVGSGVIALMEYRRDGEYQIKKLYESKELNFYNSYQVLEDMSIGRYETPEIIKVYWTDGLNNLRFLNIAPDDPNSSDKTYNNVLNTPIDKLDLIPNIKLSSPIFNGYTSGSLNSGMIQYAYRLYNLNGSESIFSLAGELIPLTKYSENWGTEYLRGQSTGGQALDTNTGKGVKVKIILSEELVYKFDKIEVISLWYADKNGLPNISIIDNKDVSTLIYVVDEGGVSEYGNIEIEEFRDEKPDFTCQTIAVKDNTMFVGNIEEQYFDINYDARAFSYDQNGKCFIYDESGKVRYSFSEEDFYSENIIKANIDEGQGVFIGTYSDEGIIPSIPDRCDCINIYNIISLDNISNKCKYKEYTNQNNFILGGKGRNISFEISTENSYAIDNNAIVTERELNVSFDVAQPDDNILSNAEWIRGSKKTYQRGEIYRFGVVFFDKKGRQSFVKWIADVRIPTNNLAPIVVEKQGKIHAVPAIPKFTINNIPSINGEVLDYRIVQVKREKEDKTIIAQGVVGALIKNNISNPIEVYPQMSISRAGHYKDGYWDVELNTANAHEIDKTRFELISPIINFDKTFTDVPTGKLELVGYIKGKNIAYSVNVNSVGFTEGNGQEHFDGENGYDIIRKYSTINGLGTTEPQRKEIREFKILIPSPREIRTTLDSVVYHPYVERFDTENHVAKRGTHGALSIDGEFVVLEESRGDLMLCNLVTEIIGYGGNTFEDRQINNYIPASNKNSGECYNGDVFICYFDYLRSIGDHALNGPASWGDYLSEIMYIPMESEFNLFYRYDDCYHKVRKSSKTDLSQINEVGFTDLGRGIDWSELYLYDEVYSKVDNSKVYIPKSLKFSLNKKFDCKVKYSNTKLNGEEKDNWTKFKVNNFKDVESEYGQLKSLINFNDFIYAFQERAISLAAINQQELISPSPGVNLVLGTGGILDRFRYITTEIGIQNNNKVIKSLQAMYFLDLNVKKIYSLGKGLDSLDDLKGLNSWFEIGIHRNSTIKGIYDNKFSEVLFTINNISTSISDNTFYTYPEATLRFNDTSASNNIKLYLLGNLYSYYTGTDTIVEEIQKFKTYLESLVSGGSLFINHYDIVINNNEITIKVKEDSLYSKNNISPYVKGVLPSLTIKTEASTQGGYTSGAYYKKVVTIQKDNTTFYADLYPGGAEDIFEILVNPVLTPESNIPLPKYNNTRASSHCNDVRFLNGNVEAEEYYLPMSIDTSHSTVTFVDDYTQENTIDWSTVNWDTSDYMFWIRDVSLSWASGNRPAFYRTSAAYLAIAAKKNYYPNQNRFFHWIGSNIETYVNYNNDRELTTSGALSKTPYILPTGIEEFHNDLNLSPGEIPLSTINGISTQQRIWVKGLNAGNVVWIRVISGNDWTGFKYNYSTIVSLGGNIEVINTQQYSEDSISMPIETRVSMLDASWSGNIITVESTDYFSFVKNRTYKIEDKDVKIIEVNKSSYEVSWNKSTDPSIVDLSYYAKYNDNFTVAYNEALMTFTGFYPFIPTRYIKFNKGYFTTENNISLYRHNVLKDKFNKFYDKLYDTYLDIISADRSSSIKEYNNIEFYCEIIEEGKYLNNTTVHSIQAENDYQQSEEVILFPLHDDRDIRDLKVKYGEEEYTKYIRNQFYSEGNNIENAFTKRLNSETAELGELQYYQLANIRRNIDHWRTTAPRDLIIRMEYGEGDYSPSNYDGEDYYVFDEVAFSIYNDYDRIRSPYCKFRFRFKNNTDIRRFILHKISILFQRMII